MGKVSVLPCLTRTLGPQVTILVYGGVHLRQPNCLLTLPRSFCVDYVTDLPVGDTVTSSTSVRRLKYVSVILVFREMSC